MTHQEIKISGERERNNVLYNLGCEPPTIRILLYADDPNGIGPGRDTSDLGTMIDHLHAHQPAFGRFEVTWLSRNSKDADNRLNREMLKLYDEIWFFGIHQLNSEPDAPQSELNEQEVEALADWMNVDETGGGVLMTGDHANSRPLGTPGQNQSCPDSSSETFLGLGRALGRCVPRAGLLRRWEGRPRKEPSALRFNTQAPVGGLDPDVSPQLQTDEFPMRLVLSRFGVTGSPSSTGTPHPLFFYPGGRFIQAFPDHTHEGAVIIPSLDPRVWPKGKSVSPKPYVVARALDYHNGRLGNILAVYDGDRGGVGRVVADSTWHHYLNENLTRFTPPAPLGSDADQIGQFYGNLGLWLAPFSKRREMAHLMVAWLASRLSVREESRGAVDESNPPSAEQVAGLGRAAYFALSNIISPCELHELLTVSLPPEYRETFEAVYLPETGVSFSLFPSKEETLGFIVDSYQQSLNRSVGPTPKEMVFGVEEAIWEGFRRAFQSHVIRFEQFALEVAQTHDLSLN